MMDILGRVWAVAGMRGKTMRILKGIGVLLTVFLLGGCHLFDQYNELSTVAVYFDPANIEIFTGGLGSLQVRVEPSDSLEYYDVVYEVLNEDVAVIYRADNRGVVFSGYGAGSTVITARIREAEAKAVITVKEQE
jgi:hypothetical protein